VSPIPIAIIACAVITGFLYFLHAAAPQYVAPIGSILFSALVAFFGRQQMRLIARSLSTRFVDSFPSYLDEIVSLIGRAKRSVVILADGVDHGSFRDFTQHQELIDAIRKARADGLDVRYFVWGDVQPMSRANKYRDAESREAEKMKFRKFVADLVKNLRPFRTNFPDAFDRVENLVADVNTDWSAPEGAIKTLQTLQGRFHDLQRDKLLESKVNIRGFVSGRSGTISAGTADEEPSQELFFWAIDGKEAVFVAPTYGEDGLGFLTKDVVLISSFQRMFERRWNYPLAQPFTHSRERP